MADASIIDIGGVQWFVKDKDARDRVTILEEKVAANFEYSEEEKQVGVWIDGRPLYRLVIQGFSTNRNVTINLSDKNIADLTKIEGICRASSQYSMPILHYLARNTTELGEIYSYVIFNETSKILEVTLGNKSYYDSVRVILQLEYTKNE